MSKPLAPTVAKIMERDQEFQPLENSMKPVGEGFAVLPLEALADWLGYEPNDKKFEVAVSRAKIALINSGRQTKDHFFDAELFDGSHGAYVSLHAALLVIINADPEKSLVAKAQNYFAAKMDKSIAEDEKRLKNRFEVIEENKRLGSAAKEAGVQNFAFFNAAGYRGMYGGKTINQVAEQKGLSRGSDVLEYAGSEELASHLFRITQTKAKLVRDKVKTERMACVTHEQIGKLVRGAIRQMGGTMPEELPAAADRIDTVETRVRTRLSVPASKSSVAAPTDESSQGRLL